LLQTINFKSQQDQVNNEWFSLATKISWH